MQDTSALDRPAFDVNTIPDEAGPIPPPVRRRSGRGDYDALMRRLENPDRDTAGPTAADDPQVAQPEVPRAPDATEVLLSTRENTHGSFPDNARLSQSLKRSFRAELGWELLSDVEREAMDMIALKFSRILSGKSLERQHWEDVVGYGKLAEGQCK